MPEVTQAFIFHYFVPHDAATAARVSSHDLHYSTPIRLAILSCELRRECFSQTHNSTPTLLAVRSCNSAVSWLHTAFGATGLGATALNDGIEGKIDVSLGEEGRAGG